MKTCSVFFRYSQYSLVFRVLRSAFRVSRFVENLKAYEVHLCVLFNKVVKFKEFNDFVLC